MTTQKNNSEETCPVQFLLKSLSGKWKPEIFKLAANGPVRFNRLLRQIVGANKQSITVALRELEQIGVLEKQIIRQKPLHIEYILTEKGLHLIPIFKQMENLLPDVNGDRINLD